MTEIRTIGGLAQADVSQAEGIGPDRLFTKTGFDMLGMNSVRRVRLLAAIPDELGIELSPVAFDEVVAAQTRQSA